MGWDMGNLQVYGVGYYGNFFHGVFGRRAHKTLEVHGLVDMFCYPVGGFRHVLMLGRPKSDWLVPLAVKRKTVGVLEVFGRDGFFSSKRSDPQQK